MMEWLLGENLRQRLDRAPLADDDAVAILADIARALDAAHEAGVLHRDLKPDNVFLVAMRDERPLVKLLDFGLAKLLGSEDTRTDRTRSGVAIGTPLYISPEQARGLPADAATDVYSLGAMAYEMLAGQPPFLADSGVEIMSMHLTTPPKPPRSHRPNLAPALDELIVDMR